MCCHAHVPWSRPLSSVHIVFNLSLPVCWPTVCAFPFLINDLFSFPNVVEGIHFIPAFFFWTVKLYLCLIRHNTIKSYRKGRWRIYGFLRSTVEEDRIPGTYWTGDWVGTRTGLDTSENRKISYLAEVDLQFPGLLVTVPPGLTRLLVQLHTPYFSLSLRLVQPFRALWSLHVP